MKLIRMKKDEFSLVYKEMEKNFPREEIRDFAPALALVDGEEKYRIYHIVDGDEKVGFLAVWGLDGFTFIEHFVVYGPYRNKGYGGLTLSLAKDEFKSLVLEAEPPETEMAKRRIAFYHRNGFLSNEEPYLQPSYRTAGEEVELVLMSYPTRLTDFFGAVKEIYTNVYKKEVRE